MPTPAPSPPSTSRVFVYYWTALRRSPTLRGTQPCCRLRLALDESDQLAVSTIHAFCKQVLGAEGFLCGMPAGFEVLPDPGDVQSDAVKDTWRTDLGADSLLAAVAACGKWSVEEDLKAWAFVDPAPLHQHRAGAPLAAGRTRRSGAGARSSADDPAPTSADCRRSPAGTTVSVNTSAKNPGQDSVAQLDTWHTTLETLDPQQPPADMFHVATRLAGARSLV